MKKLILFALLVLNSSLIFAQKTDSAASIKDTSSKKTNSPAKRTEEMSSSKNLIENLSASDEFSILISAIKAASVEETFESRGPITLFAPDNKAFGKLSPGKLDTLMMASHKEELINLLTYHAIEGKVSSKDIEKQIKANGGQATFRTLSGSILTARINENRNIVLTDENGGQSVISRFDIQQGNGMLHIITAVLFPKNITL